MIRTALVLAATFGALASPGAADNCGRWTPCDADERMGATDARSYIYGNRSDVDSWSSDLSEAPRKTAPARAPETPAASESETQTTEALRLVEPDTADPADPDTGAGDGMAGAIAAADAAGDPGAVTLSPEEEAAARAYLDSLDASREVDAGYGISGRSRESGLSGVRLIDPSDD